MNFPIEDFFSKCDQIRRTADLVTFTEEILNGKLHFLCSTYSPFTSIPESISELLLCLLKRIEIKWNVDTKLLKNIKI